MYLDMTTVYPDPGRTNHFPSAPDIDDLSIGWSVDTTDFETRDDESIGGMVASKGAVYLSASTAPEQSAPADDMHGHRNGVVRKLNAEDGTPMWMFEADYQLMGPTIADDTLYLSEHHNRRVFALDVHRGDVEWSFDAGRSYGLFRPVVSDGTVFVSKVVQRRILPGLTGAVYAIEATTGTQKWKSKQQIHRLAVGDQMLYGVSMTDPELLALDKDSGTVEWSFTLAQSPPKGSVVYADGEVYLGGSQEVICIDTSTRRVDWGSEVDRGQPGMPGVSDDAVYVGTDIGEQNGNLYAFDRKSGERIWKSSLAGRVGSQPLITGRTVYVTTYEGHIYSVDRQRGSVNFFLQLEGSDQSWVNPVADRTALYAAGVGSLYSFTAARGSGETRIYDTPNLTYQRDSPNSGPSYCPTCGTALESYEHPSYCPQCGTDL